MLTYTAINCRRFEFSNEASITFILPIQTNVSVYLKISNGHRGIQTFGKWWSCHCPFHTNFAISVKFSLCSRPELCLFLITYACTSSLPLSLLPAQPFSSPFLWLLSSPPSPLYSTPPLSQTTSPLPFQRPTPAYPNPVPQGLLPNGSGELQARTATLQLGCYLMSVKRNGHKENIHDGR